ncbi:aromatic ring-hydroxylating oxygenase subunit alpha [Methylobacterium sp. JK268]
MKHEVQVETLRILLDLRERGRDAEMLGRIAEVPARNYTDDAIFQRELDTLFRASPLVAGHASHVRRPGSTLVSDWDRLPFVVVRGQDGVLRAFLNTCRHRGAKLVTGEASERTLKAFVCPFHGWVCGNTAHILGLEEGLWAIFQHSVDQALSRCGSGPPTLAADRSTAVADEARHG